ncbi:HlyD family secretion protein [Lentibacillus halodurans]|uniref:HlyD family secretion protein n=1 Tax=Lentibacillus halodurans TaxID=237679 RepID=A0A1I1AML7_9BACI|nr:efflux RND transporter periplasmic adaptor subunit [Lentibacillus halodurans]SFB37563.1 HlyD family secretion protein [Lentibacillus halodurans]
MSRGKIIVTIVIVFIVMNCLLVYMDDEGKVARLSYIKDWSETFENDMYETIETAGVLSAVAEKNVYFDQEQGRFQEFLVEEGDVVNTGDQLFTYEVEHYAETRADLEHEQQKLTGEIEAIEAAIASMADYPIPETDENTEFEDENSTLEMTSRSVDANYMKEQYITEKENERAQKEAELQSIQTQISELDSTGETITVESPYQGEVTAISDSLENPVVRIRDLQLQAEGELTETERMEVEQDMPVEVDIRENETVLQGTLSDISDTPKTADVHGSSIYSFAASLDEEAETKETVENEAPEGQAELGQPEDSSETEQTEAPVTEGGEQTAMEGLLPGYHADLLITTNESVGATVVMDKQLVDGQIWKMANNGLLVKHTVETGIRMDELVEITEGAEPGVLIAESDRAQFHNDSIFITPLKLDDIEWKNPGKYDNVDWKRYFVTGLLSR